MFCDGTGKQKVETKGIEEDEEIPAKVRTVTKHRLSQATPVLMSRATVVVFCPARGDGFEHHRAWIF